VRQSGKDTRDLGDSLWLLESTDESDDCLLWPSGGRSEEAGVDRRLHHDDLLAHDTELSQVLGCGVMKHDMAVSQEQVFVRTTEPTPVEDEHDARMVRRTVCIPSGCVIVEMQHTDIRRLESSERPSKRPTPIVAPVAEAWS
jgi:hypothetical protein